MLRLSDILTSIAAELVERGQQTRLGPDVKEALGITAEAFKHAAVEFRDFYVVGPAPDDVPPEP